ncbi:TPA: hypothetical protein I7730_00125 [Vibrio vulnificus]|uniref:Uncharacterized protein n=1 Tax=Vibrio vulnificus TaxID=672 RepID=A0A8H9K500_VIBVL|nr:hypothetical protein [Vibrio vulnificus]HAS8538204.1 hypothetical protein [Vibrio vulnificus]
MTMYCCGCQKYVYVEIVKGNIACPHLKNYSQNSFFWCSSCKGYIAYEGGPRSGNACAIPDARMRLARRHIHARMDPIWKQGFKTRLEVYNLVSEHLGKTYHTSWLRSIDEAISVWHFLGRLIDSLSTKQQKRCRDMYKQLAPRNNTSPR